jgi:DNA polymerase-3 subunit delta'
MLFSEIIGLDDTKKILTNTVKNNHVAHAQMFLGSNGSANMAMALAYATYLNCENKGEHDACGQCPSCSKMSKLVHPDLHFLFPVAGKIDDKGGARAELMSNWRGFVQEMPYAGVQEWASFAGVDNKQLSISVDEVRDMIKDLSLKAFEGTYKVVIMWQPQMMAAAPANAMLKILEEPSPKTIFILVVNEPDKIMTTIISRTQLVKIRSFSNNEIEKYLTERAGIEEKHATQIAHIADRNLQQAFSIMNEVKDDNLPIFQKWMRHCFTRNYTEIVLMADEFHELKREGQKGFLYFGLTVLRDALVMNYGHEGMIRLPEESLAFVKNFAKVVNESNIEPIMKLLNEAYYHIERNANDKLVFVDTSISIARVIK